MTYRPLAPPRRTEERAHPIGTGLNGFFQACFVAQLALDDFDDVGVLGDWIWQF